MNWPAAPGSGWKPVAFVVRRPLCVVTLLDWSGPQVVVSAGLAAGGSCGPPSGPGAIAWAPARDAVAATAATARIPAAALARSGRMLMDRLMGRLAFYGRCG